MQEQMWLVLSNLVCVQVVYFHNANQLDVVYQKCPLRVAWVFLLALPDLEDAVKVGIVDYSEGVVVDPAEAGCDDLDGFLTTDLFPICVQHVFGDRQNHIKALCVLDLESLLAVVEVELVLEIGGKEERHGGSGQKCAWVTLDSVAELPLDHLATVLFVLSYGDVFSLVDRRDEAIDDF